MLILTKAKHQPPIPASAPDPLEDIEQELGVELAERFHELAEKPTKWPKKLRGSPAEGYRPLHRR